MIGKLFVYNNIKSVMFGEIVIITNENKDTFYIRGYEDGYHLHDISCSKEYYISNFVRI